jgi:hypothetical protein
MKINRLETHDRLEQFQQQQDNIGLGVEECIRNVPSSITCPFYVYGHSRNVDYHEQVDHLLSGASKAVTSRLIWMPVVTKPKAAPNSYLFLASKKSDVVKIIWMLPKRELWDNFAPGKMMHNENVWTSIQNYKKYRDVLNVPDKDGPTEKDVLEFRKIIGAEAQKKQKQKQIAEILR